MPPQLPQRTKDFIIEKYKAIANSDKSTVDQQLKALALLERLIDRTKNPNKKTSGSFKKGDPRVTRRKKNPNSSESRLLGVGPSEVAGLSDAALLGLVEHVQSLAEPLEPASSSGSSGAA